MNTASMASWNSLAVKLQDVSRSLTLNWIDLEEIVGELPASASNYRAWWSGTRPHVQIWKSAGFTITNLHLGSQVTFVRKSEETFKDAQGGLKPEIKRTPTGENRVVKELPHPDILLVSCVSRKLSKPALAKDLYVSDLFRKEKAYAERSGLPWYILSAEYGLVDPDDWLAPYDRYLPKESKAYQRTWGLRVVAALDENEAPLQGKIIEIHAAVPYFAAIRTGLQSHGAIVTRRWEGLRGIGEILHWYSVSLSEATQ